MHFILLTIAIIFMLAGVSLISRKAQGGWHLLLSSATGAAVILLDLLIDRIQHSREYKYTVELTADEILCRRSDGEHESVLWRELKSVSAYGAYLEGYTLLLNGTTSGCAVPCEAEGFTELLKRMKSLPGFNWEAIHAASMSQDREEYLCWVRTA